MVHRVFVALAFGIAAVGLSSCGRPAVQESPPQPRQLGAQLGAYRPPEPPRAPEVGDAVSPAPPGEASGELPLRDALALALRDNPRLAAFSWEVRAMDGEVLQAGLLPNPELEGEYERLDAGTETTIVLGQLIELGGKRTQRTQLAARERDLARWDYAAVRLDVFTEVTQRFVAVLGAQQRVDLAERLTEVASQALEVAKARVEAGKVSPIDEVRARVESSNAEIELQRARRALIAARKNLSATWANPEPRFERAEGNLAQIRLIPELERLRQALVNNPNVARWQAERERREAAVALAESRAIPDVTLSAGVRQSAENEQEYLVGVAVPLPLFDRNQGEVSAQRARLAGVELERRSAQAAAEAALAETYESANAALSEVVTLQNDVLPGARRAFEAIQEGYRLGKFSILEVLDAQRTLFETRSRFLDALVNYQSGVADLERLIGQSLEQIGSPGDR